MATRKPKKAAEETKTVKKKSEKIKETEVKTIELPGIPDDEDEFPPYEEATPQKEKPAKAPAKKAKKKTSSPREAAAPDEAPEAQETTSNDSEKEQDEPKEKVSKKEAQFEEFEIPIDSIDLGEHQPRDRDGLEARGRLTDLADNIRDVGLLQPILVEPTANGRYLLISGERRLRACMKLKHKKIRAVLPSKRTLQSIEKDGRTLHEIALFENLRRKDLTAIEEGRSYQQILKILKIEQKDLAKRLGVDDAYISRRISFLSLPKDVQEMLEEGKINATQAEQIVRLQKIKKKSDREEAQVEVAKQIEVEKLTYRKAKALVDELLGEKKKRDATQLTRLGAKKAVYFISMLDEKFGEIDLDELKGEEEQEKLQQLNQAIPSLIKKLEELQQKVGELVQ